MNLDPVRRQQFQNERATMFVNDFPEVDVRDPHGPNIPVVVAPGEGKIPTNILKETNWDLKSFPCLYPDGKKGTLIYQCNLAFNRDFSMLMAGLQGTPLLPLLHLLPMNLILLREI